MPGFLTPVDIANRACQHCGVTRIDYAQGFEEDSKAASEIGFVYDKLRQAELRRNTWRFAIKHAVLRPMDDDTRLLAPAMWSGNTTYCLGEIVTDVLNYVWVSTAPQNTNRPPGYAKGWAPYFGPLTIQPFDEDLSYWAGDVVYVAAGDGTYSLYFSLKSDNDSVPGTPEDWDDETTYRVDDLVTVSSTVYRSLIDLNVNQAPASTYHAAWAVATTYTTGDKVVATNGYIYTSVGAGNTGNDPLYDISATYWTKGALAAWTTDTTGRGTGSTNWQPLVSVLQDYRLLSPMLSGLTLQRTPVNAYRLPANYLRMAPQNPKAGSYSYLGAPSGLSYDDWNIEGDYIVTTDSGALILRFVADFVDVASMDAMFCEGLAARIGLEVCEPLTQSTAKKQAIASEYNKFMTEARIINGIETGPTEPPVDDWVACRT